MDPHSRAPKKNTKHGNDVLPQDTTHLIQRPCYQRGSPCQDAAGDRTTRRPPDHVKRRKLQLCGHVSRSLGLAETILQGTVKGGRRHGRQKKRWEDNISERTNLEVRKVPEGSGKQRKMEETGCEVICDAPTTPAVKELVKVKEGDYTAPPGPPVTKTMTFLGVDLHDSSVTPVARPK